MPYATPAQLPLPPSAGDTVRADGAGGAWSSDFGALVRRGSERQLGLTARRAAAIQDKRPPAALDHPLRALVAQRLSQSAAGSADGHEAPSLRHAPLGQRSVERPPLEPAQDVARAPTSSRLEPRVAHQDLSRLSQAFVAPCSASDPAPPAALGLDREHAAAPTPGPQACACSHPPSQRSCALPCGICAGTSHAWLTACLRPGTRPTGAETARRFGRLLSSLRRHWPPTHILGRGARHGATPEGIAGLAEPRQTDFGGGRAGQAVGLRPAAPVRQAARRLSPPRTTRAHGHGERPPPRRRLSAECAEAAAAWAQPWRVLVTAAGLAAGAKPRVVVTACAAPPPPKGMTTSPAHEGLAQTTAKRSRGTSTATGPRRRRAGPTLCGSAGRARPRGSTRPSARPRWPTRHWRQPHLPHGCARSSQGRRRLHRTKPAAAAPGPRPARSQHSCTGARPCSLPSPAPRSTRLETLAVLGCVRCPRSCGPARPRPLRPHGGPGERWCNLPVGALSVHGQGPSLLAC
jgi:hypothetical protein